ncbi:hypothetical protein BKA81DRAFT_17750 [Phyllosticta paracitricarpa]
MAVHEFDDQIGPFTARWTTRCKRCIGAGNRPASRCIECLDWLAGRTLARCRGSIVFTKWPVHPRIPATGRLVPVLGEVAGDPPPPHFQRTTQVFSLLVFSASLTDSHSPLCIVFDQKFLTLFSSQCARCTTTSRSFFSCIVVDPKPIDHTTPKKRRETSQSYQRPTSTSSLFLLRPHSNCLI